MIIFKIIIFVWLSLNNFDYNKEKIYYIINFFNYIINVSLYKNKYL